MYIESKTCWLNHINNALDKDNNRVHGTTKMTPFEMVSNNTTAIPNLIPFPKFPEFPKFQLYSKGYTTNWNRELFKIHNINTTNPVTYTLEDENKAVIQGKYYEQGLFLRSAFNFESNNKTLESMNIFHQHE